MTRRDAIIGTAFAATTLLGADQSNPTTDYELPLHFSSFDELERWSKQCLGGGSCRKFVVPWKRKVVELCYSSRRFTSASSTTEITFWRPDDQGGWVRTVGTTIIQADLKVATSDAGCSVNGFDVATNSWSPWLIISTPMLCDRIE